MPIREHLYIQYYYKNVLFGDYSFYMHKQDLIEQNFEDLTYSAVAFSFVNS